MLKIKDNVALKELEKFGFENVERERFFNKYSHLSKCNTPTNRIWVHLERHLSFNNPTNKVFDTLYDLIKADLVEKVGDKNEKC